MTNQSVTDAVPLEKAMTIWPRENGLPTHRHIASGNLYQVIGRGHDCTNGDPVKPVVLYRDCTGDYWTRYAPEFNDGRFEELPRHLSSPQVESGIVRECELSIDDAEFGMPEHCPTPSTRYETMLSEQLEVVFHEWKMLRAPDDSGEDYDWRGAFVAGCEAGTNGHWPDLFKKPNHPTFSNESVYAANYIDGGKWNGTNFVSPQVQDGEIAHASKLSNIILDRPLIDPDCDEAVLARQFLRQGEKNARLVAENERLETANNDLRDSLNRCIENAVRDVNRLQAQLTAAPHRRSRRDEQSKPPRNQPRPLASNPQ